MNVLLASVICPEAVENLQTKHAVTCGWHAQGEEFAAMLGESEAVVFRSGVEMSAAVMSRAPKLRLLVRAGAGLDNLDAEHARSRNIRLVCIPVPGGRAVAELTMALMLMLARKILVADQALRRGRWLKHDLNGCLLHDKCLGIVGAGRIGSLVGEMGATLGMKVVGCVARPSAAKAEKLARKGLHLTNFDAVIEQADFLSIHLPLTAETRNLVNQQVLSRTKPGAFLINLGRGGVVDEEALLQALTQPAGLGGAALDVHCCEGEGQVSPLAALPNVVLTPHIGSTTVETQREIGRHVVAAIEAFSEGQES